MQRFKVLSAFLYCLVQQDKVLFVIIIMYIFGGGNIRFTLLVRNIIQCSPTLLLLLIIMLWIQQVLIMASKDLALVSKQMLNNIIILI